ncbi:MAG: carboxypeptidase regulatory-like domain-containing protein [Planctomycetaceae bacterium]
MKTLLAGSMTGVRQSFLWSFTLAASAVLAGCGEYGGGAVVVPRVTFLPADLSGDGAGAASEDTTGDPSADVSAGGVGSIVGRVQFQGGDMNLAPLFVKGADIKDKEVCAAVDVPDERLVLGADNGVANVFVFMKKAPKGAPKMTPPTEPLIFDQKNCRFLPRCMIVPVGQAVKVLSDDPIAHNTHTNPAKNNSVSQLVDPGDRAGTLELTYTRSEDPFSVTCDFHTWMKAYHMPMDHPYGAVTDENGKFEIQNVPAGDHEFVVWHESADGQYLERKLKVKVGVGEPTTLEIPYPADKLKL